jgi:DNA-binding transcriptional LysR family regulator
MTIDLLQLRRAQVLAECRSFALAAKELHISQPGLSRSIKELEARVGTPLFVRAAGTVYLTDAGRHMLSYAADILDRADNLVRELDLFSGRGNDELVVGAGSFTADLYVAGAAARFSKAYPLVRLRLVIDHWLNLVGLVRKRQVDMAAIEISSVQDEPELRVSLAQRVQACFAVRAGHPLLARTSPDLSDILRYPLVGPSQLPARFVDALLQAVARNRDRDRKQRAAQPSIACDSSWMTRAIVEQSDAVGVVTASMVTNEVDAGRLALLPLEESWNWGLFGLVQAPHRQPSAAEHAFVRCLGECFQERMALEVAARDRLLELAKRAGKRHRTTPD